MTMRFARTGRVACYGTLGGADHELLWYDFRRRAEILAEHPFAAFFLDTRYAEVEQPATVPALDLAAETPAEAPLRHVA